MSGDEYLRNILSKYAVTVGEGSAASNAANQIYPIIQKWAGNQLRQVSFSGSYAKGTGVRGVTDVDLFISLESDTDGTLKEIFDSLYNRMYSSGYSSVRKQHVSIHVNHGGIDVDLVPGVKQTGNTEDHWLYVNKAGKERIQTNVNEHINIVKESGRIDEIKVIKIWRKLRSLDVCSFYLELVTIEALKGCRTGQLASNVWRVLEFLRDSFTTSRFVDPSNTNNIISDELTSSEKRAIAEQARISCSKKTWEEIVW